MKTLFILILGLFLCIGCEKKETDLTTTVTLTMPNLNLNETYSLSASAPSTINDINCFAVMVKGAEPNLNRSTCTVVDSSGSQISESKKLGLFRGLVPSGGSISLEIPAGSQRQFTLLGVKANPISTCMDINSQFSSEDFTSDFFIVGESGTIDLQPGATVNVPIKISSSGTAIGNNSGRLGDCTGPDSPFKNRIIPTKVNIVKDDFPYDFFGNVSCQPININFTNDSGRIGGTARNYNFTLERATTTAGVTSGYSIANLFSDSSCMTSISSEFTVPAKTKKLRFYTSFGPSPNFIDYVSFRLRSGTINLSPFAETTSENFMLAQNSEGAVDIFGARRVVSDMCYDMTGMFKNTNLAVVSGSAYSVSYPDIEGRIFPGKKCTNSPITNSTPYEVTVGADFEFSMRYSQNSLASTYFSMTPTVLTTSATVAGKYPVQVVGGSHDPVFLRPELPEKLPLSAPGCYGPYQVLIENERGAALVTDGSITISLSSGPSSIIGFYNNRLCNQSLIASITNDYRKVFYIGVNTNITSPISINVRVTGQIDHPDDLENTSRTVNLSTEARLNF